MKSEHNETIGLIKSHYQTNGYWIMKYYLDYLKRQLMTKDCLWGLKL